MTVPRMALMALLVAGTASASEPLTLPEALGRARMGAREVAAARARGAAAGERLAQARGYRLPGVSFQEIWSRTDSPAEAFALKLNQERFSFADFTTSDPNRPAALATGISRFEVSLPVFTGGELSGRIQQAKMVSDAADASTVWAGEQAALAAGEAYVMLWQAEEYVALLGRARETVAAHVDLARAYVKQGMLVSSDLLRAEVELARVEDMFAQAKGRARVASANLAFRLGVDQATQWKLAPPPPVGREEPLEQYLASAGERRDVVSARRLLQAGELEEKVRTAAYLPKVGILGRADWVDDHPFGRNGSATAVMAVASINLFAGGSDRAAIAAARHEAKAGALDVARFEEGVGLEVREAWEEAGTARLRQETAARGVEAATEALRIVQERFKTGVVKMLDLLDADTARREAETRELVARSEAVTASLRLVVRSGRAAESILQ